jgi:hypothetical protein
MLCAVIVIVLRLKSSNSIFILLVSLLAFSSVLDLQSVPQNHLANRWLFFLIVRNEMLYSLLVDIVYHSFPAIGLCCICLKND